MAELLHGLLTLITHFLGSFSRVSRGRISELTE